jgi:hypothetical protein
MLRGKISSFNGKIPSFHGKRSTFFMAKITHFHDDITAASTPGRSPLQPARAASFAAIRRWGGDRGTSAIRKNRWRPLETVGVGVI